MLRKQDVIYFSFKLSGRKYALLIFFSLALTISLLLFTQSILKGYEQSLLTKIIGSSPHVSIHFNENLDDNNIKNIVNTLPRNIPINFVAKGLAYFGTADIFSAKEYADNFDDSEWTGESLRSQSPEIFFKGMIYSNEYAEYLSKVLISFDRNQNGDLASGIDLSTVERIYTEKEDRSAWDGRLKYRKPIAFPPSLYRELINPSTYITDFPYIRLSEAERNFGIVGRELKDKKTEFVVVALLDTPISDETISIVSAYETMKYLIKGTSKGDDTYNYLEIYLTNPMQSKELATQLEKKGIHASITVWSDKYIGELALIKAFNVLLYSVMLGIGISIGLLLSSLLSITIRRKRRQLSVLLALGSTKKLILEIFIYYSLFLGFFGFLFGYLIAKLLTYSLWDFVQTGNDIFNDYPVVQILHLRLQGIPIPHDIKLLESSSIAILIIVLIICFISSWGPSAEASKINPIEGLKES